MPDEQSRDIVIVANNVEELGGVQRVAHTMAELFTSRGHRVQLIGVDHPAVRHDYGARGYSVTVLNETPEPREMRVGRLRSRLDPRAKAARAAKQNARRAAVGRLSGVLADLPPGGIVIVMQVWASQWVKAADTRGLKVIGMSHESYAASVTSSRYSRMGPWYRDLDLFLLLTEEDARRFERDGFNNVGVMHNPLSFFPDAVSELTNPVVVAAGRYAPEKGYERLIDAFAMLSADHPDWSLRIFGHGPLDAALREQVRRLGLEGQIHLPGLAADIEAELRASSVFALSSLAEGLPLALAEAMSCGVPCVAVDCAPGVREIITAEGADADGIVVPPRDLGALADGLRRLMDDAALRSRLGAAARRNIKRFSPEVIAERWEEVFCVLDR